MKNKIVKINTDNNLGQAAILLGHNLLETCSDMEIEYFIGILKEFTEANHEKPESKIEFNNLKQG